MVKSGLESTHHTTRGSRTCEGSTKTHSRNLLTRQKPKHFSSRLSFGTYFLVEFIGVFHSYIVLPRVNRDFLLARISTEGYPGASWRRALFIFIFLPYIFFARGKGGGPTGKEPPASLAGCRRAGWERGSLSRLISPRVCSSWPTARVPCMIECVYWVSIGA